MRKIERGGRHRYFLLVATGYNHGVRAVVLSDTHMRAGSKRTLPDAVADALRDADVILHAGDLIDASLLVSLRQLAPVHAVLGNNDLGLDLPITREIELDGVRVAMVHDSGPRKGREARMWRLFPAADVVVFGHSHIPWNAPGVGRQLLFNPGSPTERRRQPHRSYGVLELRDGRVARHDIVPVAN